jgi:hypothetical protein
MALPQPLTPEISPVLLSMLQLLQGGNAWTKHANARDSFEMPVPILSDDAIKWDLFGAIVRVLGPDRPFALYQSVYDYIRTQIPQDYKSRDMEAWNDDIEWVIVESILNVDFEYSEFWQGGLFGGGDPDTLFDFQAWGF